MTACRAGIPALPFSFVNVLHRPQSACRAALAPIVAVLLTTVLSAQATSGDPAVGATTLQAGDVLRVAIWREPDLSGEFVVNEAGVVTLPLLGQQNVASVPLSGLRQRLLQQYQVQLRNPSIELTPLRRVQVLGEVGRPGVYTVDPTTSLAGVVAMAGGATGSGNLRHIRIVRGGEVVREQVGAATSLQQADIRSGDQIMIQPRSWFERNVQFVVGVLFTVTGIIINLSR